MSSYEVRRPKITEELLSRLYLVGSVGTMTRLLGKYRSCSIIAYQYFAISTIQFFRVILVYFYDVNNFKHVLGLDCASTGGWDCYIFDRLYRYLYCYCKDLPTAIIPKQFILLI